MDSRSGAGQKQPRPVVVTVLAIQPDPLKTPWWVRRSGLEYSHVVIAIGNVIWDQPWKGKAAAYDANEWVDEKDVIERGYQRVDIHYPDHDPMAYLAACVKCEGRRSQRWRTALRFLKLWPKPAWNCTSPIREILNALDPDNPVTGETADAIIEELTHD